MSIYHDIKLKTRPSFTDKENISLKKYCSQLNKVRIDQKWLVLANRNDAVFLRQCYLTTQYNLFQNN